MRLLGLSVFALVAAAAPAPTTVRPEEVVNHLETSIAWFRHVNLLEQTPSASVNTLLRERTRDSALQALRLAFTFARAENALLALNRPPTQNQANPQGTGQNLQQALSRAA